jgi:DNA mismatch repair protein MutS2
VEFDEERLEPTFRLSYGRPGRSYALAIATKLGLSQELIARAQNYLSSESRRLADLLQSLEERERGWEARAAEGSALEARLAELRREAETLLERARQEARSRTERARDEAHRLIVDAKRQVQAELDRLKIEAATRRSLEESLRRLRRVEGELPPPPQEEILPPGADEVLISSLGLRGRIVEERDGLVTVQAGALTVRVSRSQLAAPPGKPIAPPEGKVALPEKSGVSPELLLLGRTTDEARDLVVKYLDDAILAGLPQVRLVHGKGTGALKKAVQALLKEHPLVVRFRAGAPHEGGAGATVVELQEGH